MSSKITRRSFLKGTAVGGASLLILRDSRLAFGYEQNSKLNIAKIGCGGMGKGDLGAVSGENIVALCDVDKARAMEPLKDFPNAKVYSDFRRMFDQMHHQIDAVVISTPDHTHAPSAAMAMKMGKHVYCQKPLTHSISEARTLLDLSRRYKVATQMGNQGTASNSLREAVEVIQSGAIGEVFEIHAWTDRPIWPQGCTAPAAAPAVPADLDWEAWIGPAPYRAFADGYHPFKWRGWIDYGTGALGDMGCHIINIAFMALDLKNPISVEAEVHELTADAYPNSSVVKYLYAATPKRRSVRLTWYDGGLKPPDYVSYGEKLGGNGAIVIGTKGRLWSDSHGGHYEMLPRDEFVSFKPPAPTLPRAAKGHYQEWIDACKGGAPGMSNFEYSVPLTETVLLGNLAVLTGEPIYWDSENIRAINCPKADRYIRRDYRKGWNL